MNIMNTPLTSPLSPLSPTLGTNFVPAKFRNRVPTQLRRTVPIYVATALLILLVLNADVFRIAKAPSAGIFKRGGGTQYFLGSSSSPSGLDDFPKKIWQTWKMDPLHFAQRDSDTARSWTSKNPGYRYEVLTDANDLAYVAHAFGPAGFNRPDIVGMYAAINATIIKADLLRYMVMYAEGGVYADIDVEALKPVARFLPERYNPADVDLVIGIEIDQPEFSNHPILGQKSKSFCQWTFMAKPGLPVFLRLVETIMAWLADIARKQKVPVSEVVLDFDEVISGTGPSAFTAAVLADMNSRAAPGERGRITWDRFHNLDESKVVSRVLVLDVEAFAAGQGHSDSGNHNSRSALVKHHYHASNWPSRHPRFSHPVYGEVERCNWDADCVRQWDEDVEAYKNLSPEEQKAKIAQAEAEQSRKLEEAKAAQEQALKLEKWAAAVQMAEDEARKELRAEKVAPLAGGLGVDAAAAAPGMPLQQAAPLVPGAVPPGAGTGFGAGVVPRPQLQAAPVVPVAPQPLDGGFPVAAPIQPPQAAFPAQAPLADLAVS